MNYECISVPYVQQKRETRSKDLVADGQPKRIKLLGEDLVSFRDTENRVGLSAHPYAHREALMTFGRNGRAAFAVSITDRNMT